MSDVATVSEQTTLLDLNGREIHKMWVDDNAPLFVANNPLHWKAHKLQIALARLDKLMETNPGQVNTTVYFSTLDKLSDLMDQINGDKPRASDDEILGSGNVAESRDGAGASGNGQVKPISMDS